MNRSHILLAAVSLAVASLASAQTAPVAPAAHAQSATVFDASNPFAKPSTLPFNYPAWDKIRNEHFAPAFAEGMRQEAREVEAIANNKAAPTFDNTIVAMEKSGLLLTRVSTVFSALQSANTNDKIDAVDREMAPKLAAHADAIFLNDKLYKLSLIHI